MKTAVAAEIKISKEDDTQIEIIIFLKKECQEIILYILFAFEKKGKYSLTINNVFRFAI